MKLAILGTGMVGTTIGSKLIQLGHQVRMGSRTATNEKAAAWAKAAGPGTSHGTFADAAAFGDIIFNCTAGVASLEALNQAGAKNLNGKIIVDVSNPLDFSKGMPPTLTVCNTDSVGEQIQRTFPSAKVVKALNTVNCAVMVNPAHVPGDHDMFLCGNDQNAKLQVTTILKEWLGWNTVIDLGDISNARAMEMYVTFWVRLYIGFQSPKFNIKVVK